MTVAVESILVVEDAPGEAALRRVVAAAAPQWSVYGVIDCKGSGKIRARFQQYRNASQVLPHVVLTDLDRYVCPTALLTDWNAHSEPPRLVFRIAVREVESWLLGDRAGTAELLRIALNKVPAAPEGEADPKRCLINLARSSPSGRVRQEFCPAPGSKASQGPLYNERVTRFFRERWNLSNARANAPSLDRACRRIAEAAKELT